MGSIQVVISHKYFKTSTSLKSHGVLEKVQGITMDNASSNTTFMQQFSKIMEENMLDCFAHIFNLAVQDALKHLYADCKDENTGCFPIAISLDTFMHTATQVVFQLL